MTKIDLSAEQRPFDPETAEAMGLAFDAAWQSLTLSSSKLTSPELREVAREQIALRIIETAQKGERDVNRLRDDAVAHVRSLNLDGQTQVAAGDKPAQPNLGASA